MSEVWIAIWIFLLFISICSGLFYKYADGNTGLDYLIKLFKKDKSDNN